MDLLAPVNNYCERLGPGLFAEPLNALSNVAFLFASAWLLLRLRRQPGSPWYARVLAGLIFAIGLGSLSFHTFANQGTEILDVLFIAIYIHFYVACFFRHFLLWPWWQAALTVPGFYVFGRVVSAPFGPAAFNGSIIYFPALAGLLLFATTQLVANRQGGRILALAAGVFVVSVTLRSEDQAWCTALPIGTHWIWHCLNAVTLTLVTLSLGPERTGRDELARLQ
jgi:hypothetical protein